jgi:flagellar hook-length control protein FliK
MTAQGLLVKGIKRQRITSHDSCFGISKSLFERLEADMNLPLSNAVNPALASALLTVSSPAQGAGMAPALGGAVALREDFAQHFSRMARQIQPRSPLAEAPPQRQHLATDTPHRSDARFAARPPITHEKPGPARPEPQGAQKPMDDDTGADDAGPKATMGAAPDRANAPSAQAQPAKEASTSATAESPSDATDTEDNAAASKDGAATSPNPAWVAIGPEGLKTWQISERVQVITSNEPLPDPQSNAQFARSMGFDEQMIQRLFGPAPADATGAAASLGATPGTATVGAMAAGLGQPPSFTVSAEAAKAMAGLSAASASAAQGLPTVGDLQNLGAQSIHIAEMADAQLAAAPQAGLTLPTVSTQNMLAMLSAFVPNADSKRLTGDSDSPALDTIDLSGLVGESPGSALNLASPSAARNNPAGGVSNPNLAPTSTDMAQTYQDLSDKLSTELAGRMHQQLNEGQWKMKLGLKPSHLGAVDVELEMRDGKLSAVINADNATTQQLLNQGSPRLREALNALGWDQASVNIGQGHSSSAQSGQGQGQHTGQPGSHVSRGEPIHGDGSDASPNKTQNTSNALLDIYA